jgi:DNA invertase Pin-like site-specific DNA recombinase
MEIHMTRTTPKRYAQRLRRAEAKLDEVRRERDRALLEFLEMFGDATLTARLFEVHRDTLYEIKKRQV